MEAPEGRRGKAGPRGEKGEPGVVDQGIIEEMVQEQVASKSILFNKLPT